MKVFRQRPYKGGRDPLLGCLLPSVAAEVREQAKRYHVYPSFVISTIVARAFGAGLEQENYQTVVQERLKNEKRERRAKRQHVA